MVNRDSNSGTWETFRDLVLTPRQLELHDDARRYESNTVLTQVISTNPDAIGFVALANIGQSQIHPKPGGSGHCLQVGFVGSASGTLAAVMLSFYRACAP